FFQVTRDTTVDSLSPLWAGWGRGPWGYGWNDWGAGPSFITHYTGRVVANLSAPSGAHMRCKFQLASPDAGMAGGGAGQCPTIGSALDRGINLIDTAPVYGFGVSEEIVGKALGHSGLRSRAVIATKVGLEWRDGKVYRNATRRRIVQEIDDSLRRLRTDYIDIYQVHWPDPLTPVEETADAMRALHEQGKISALGVGNFSVEQMQRFRSVAPLHVLQAPYNLFERSI